MPAQLYSNKKVFLFIILLSTNVVLGQSRSSIGLVMGSGLADLKISYSDPTWRLGGISAKKPLNIGMYSEYSVSKIFKVGFDLTYYHLPIQIADYTRTPVLKETFNYLNISPYFSCKPLKWFSISFNLSLRPLLNHNTAVLGPTSSLLTYYGPRFTIIPFKQVGIDFGYENHAKYFAIANLGAYRALFSNSILYTNIRFSIINAN